MLVVFILLLNLMARWINQLTSVNPQSEEFSQSSINSFFNFQSPHSFPSMTVTASLNTQTSSQDICMSLENVSISYGGYEAVRNVYCEIPRGKVLHLSARRDAESRSFCGL